MRATCKRCNGSGVLSCELDDDCPVCWGAGVASEDERFASLCDALRAALRDHGYGVLREGGMRDIEYLCEALDEALGR
jgi:hypothetical protein